LAISFGKTLDFEDRHEFPLTLPSPPTGVRIKGTNR